MVSLQTLVNPQSWFLLSEIMSDTQQTKVTGHTTRAMVMVSHSITIWQEVRSRDKCQDYTKKDHRQAGLSWAKLSSNWAV